MNGEFKNKENENIFGYNNSQNITHKNMNLSDYLDLLENKLKSTMYNNLSYKLFGLWQDKQITADNTYQSFNTSGGLFNGRRNTNINPYKLNNDGSIELENINADYVFTKISFVTQCNSQTSGNKYARIRIVRDGQELATQISSSYNNGSGSASMHVIEYGLFCKNGDKIYFDVYGKTGDTFSKTTYTIELQNLFYNLDII